jgi:hypothetical protein
VTNHLELIPATVLSRALSVQAAAVLFAEHHSFERTLQGLCAPASRRFIRTLREARERRGRLVHGHVHIGAKRWPHVWVVYGPAIVDVTGMQFREHGLDLPAVYVAPVEREPHYQPCRCRRRCSGEVTRWLDKAWDRFEAESRRKARAS